MNIFIIILFVKILLLLMLLLNLFKPFNKNVFFFSKKKTQFEYTFFNLWDAIEWNMRSCQFKYFLECFSSSTLSFDKSLENVMSIMQNFSNN